MLYLHCHCCCSVTKSCPTLYYPMNCSTTGFPVLHCLPEFAQTYVHWVSNAIHPSSVIPFCCPQSFPTSESFPVSQLFASGGQSTGISTSASVLTANIQGWFPLGLAGLITLLSKGLSRVFSSTTVQKHQFVSMQPSFGFPGISAVKESTYSAGDPGVGKIPWRRERLPTPVFFPRGFHGQRPYGLWGRK